MFYTKDDEALMIMKMVDPIHATKVIFSQKYPDGMLDEDMQQEELLKILAEVLLSEN